CAASAGSRYAGTTVTAKLRASCPSGGRCAMASPARYVIAIPTRNHRDTNRRIVVPPSENACESKLRESLQEKHRRYTLRNDTASPRGGAGPGHGGPLPSGYDLQNKSEKKPRPNPASRKPTGRI